MSNTHRNKGSKSSGTEATSHAAEPQVSEASRRAAEQVTDRGTRDRASGEEATPAVAEALKKQ